MKEVTNVKINKKLVSEREGLCRGGGVGEGLYQSSHAKSKKQRAMFISTPTKQTALTCIYNM